MSLGLSAISPPFLIYGSARFDKQKNIKWLFRAVIFVSDHHEVHNNNNYIPMNWDAHYKREKANSYMHILFLEKL